MTRNIGEMIRESRKRQNMTQGELGQVIGVSAATVCEIEAGGRKSDPSPEFMVGVADAVHDSRLLQEFCNSCPVRKRIIIRKFAPLNNIIPGTLPAILKNIQKLTTAAEKLQQMVPKMLNKGFESDPDFIEFRNDTIILGIDVRRGLEIFFDQMLAEKRVTEPELKHLEDVQYRMCIAKGHHIEVEEST